MLKIWYLWMMLSICVTAFAQIEADGQLITIISEAPVFKDGLFNLFAQDTSSDCDKEYYERYGRWMENHLVTWWGIIPIV